MDPFDEFPSPLEIFFFHLIVGLGQIQQLANTTCSHFILRRGGRKTKYLEKTLFKTLQETNLAACRKVVIIQTDIGHHRLAVGDFHVVNLKQSGDTQLLLSNGESKFEILLW